MQRIMTKWLIASSPHKPLIAGSNTAAAASFDLNFTLSFLLN
jgi:hypothetical protein